MTKSKTNAGKIFETNWKKSYPDQTPIYYLRLVDSVKWGIGAGSRFQAENPYDSLQFRMPFIYLLELKSTINISISFNGRTPWEKPDKKKTLMIKPHQVKSLIEAAKTEGVIAGFVLNFREHVTKTKNPKTLQDETYFIHINDFIEFSQTEDKASISREDCSAIGYRIRSTKKKVNYTYDVIGFTKETPKLYLSKGYIDKSSLVQARKRIDELIEMS